MENQCDELVECEHFLQHTGINRWPDGTVSSQYSFIHALYENVIYERTGESRKTRLHQSIGERLESAYKNATEEIAAELANHFERSGDYHRALQYLLQSAEKVFHRSAYQEVIDYCQTALALIKSSKNAPPSDEIEMRLNFLLGISLTSSRGYIAGEAREAYSKAQTISQHIGNEIVLFQTLTGLWSFHLLRGEVHNALELGDRMLKLAERTRNADFMLEALMTSGVALFFRGRFNPSQEPIKHALPYYDIDGTGSLISVFGHGVGAVLYCYNARIEDATACFRRAIQIARGQKAKSLELRAAMSLCRLRQSQGKERKRDGC